MIPNNSAVATTEGDLGGEEIKMGISEAAHAHIITILTDLYSDPAAAVIREYSTNALDANVQAGVTKPIEITLPNRLSPYFRVKDDGVGLNSNDIRETYSQYGESTKRASNLTNGMLGLGCKSALTYTSQFTVTSVKGGVKTIVAVSRKDDGTPTMKVVDTVSTTESNYTEITVPVSSYDTFVHKAREFFQYWAEGTVLIDGAAPERFKGDEVVPGKVWLTPGYTSRVVMGNVAYPLDNSHLTGLPMGQCLIIYVKMGEVNFAPPREALHFTDRTKATIAKYNDLFTTELAKRIVKDITNAASKPEALAAFNRWKKIVTTIQRKDFTYKGEQLPADHYYYKDGSTDDRDRILYTTASTNSYYGQRASNGKYPLSLTNFAEKPVVIVNYPAEFKTGNPQRDKMREHFKSLGINVPTSVMLLNDGEIPKDDWIEVDSIHDWKEIRKIKLAPSPNAGQTYDGAYDVYENGSWTVRHLDPAESYVYWTPAEHKPSISTLTTLLPGVTLVKVNMNRWDKMKRLCPNATSLRQAAQNLGDVIGKGASYEVRVHLSFAYYEVDRYGQYDLSKIDDPDVKKFILACKDSAAQDQARLIKHQFATVRNIGFSNLEMKFDRVENPLNVYPLFNSSYREDSYEYMNFKYAQKKEKK